MEKLFEEIENNEKRGGREMRICNIFGIVLMVIGLLTISAPANALTDGEILRRLDERFVSGEISEETYKELKAKYSGGKTQSAESGSAENLVTNGDFEGEFIKDAPQGWTRLREIERSLDEQVFHSGAKSIRFNSDSNVDEAGMSQVVSVAGGKAYTFTVWRKQQGIQAQSDESLTCEIRVGSKSQYINMGVSSGDSDWKKFTSKVQVPQDISEITIKFFYWHAKGTTWIDDVSLL